MRRGRTMATLPFVITKKDGKERQFDIFSLLLSDRIVFINGPIDDLTANSVVAQLLYLDSEDSEKDICLYINSPGGSVTAGMAIHDTMRYIKAPVHTIGIGLAASMGALILASGNKRSVLPNTKVMIHQPLVSRDLGGKETDIKILAKDLANTRQMISRILAEHCRKPREVVEQDIENDCYMCAQEALEYGICDNIINIS